MQKTITAAAKVLAQATALNTSAKMEAASAILSTLNIEQLRLLLFTLSDAVAGANPNASKLISQAAQLLSKV